MSTGASQASAGPEADPFLATYAPNHVAANRAYFEASVASLCKDVGRRHGSLIIFGACLAIPYRAGAAQHLENATEAGATNAEVAETIMSSAALSSGAAHAYGRMAFKMLDREVTRSPGHIYDFSDTKYARQWRIANPELFASFNDYRSNLHSTENALPPAIYELTALASAVVAQCPYCIAKHANDAVEAGAPESAIASLAHLLGHLRAEATIEVGIETLTQYSDRERHNSPAVD